ncbi:MAG TPA: LPS assembly lipoprotein LptE [Roseovarius sp.]
MSSFNRRVFCLMALAAVPACGFTPVYGPNGAGTALQGKVLVDAPVTRDAYLLTRELESRLGRANPGRYGLSYSITLGTESIGVTKTNVSTRYNMLGNATYALRDLDGGEVVTSGKVNNFVGYSASGSTVATQASEGDARKRLMNILADQIVTRLIVAVPATGL